MRRHTMRAYEIMRSAWPAWDTSLDDDHVELWGKLLEDLPAADLLAALRELAMTSEYPPSPAQIRRQAQELRGPGRRHPDGRPMTVAEIIAADKALGVR